MDWRMDAWGVLMRVSPFRHLRISGYLLLPAAFRSLSRLSSALSAKASTLRSFLLDQFYHFNSVWNGVCFLKKLVISFSTMFTFGYLFSRMSWLKYLFYTDIFLNTYLCMKFSMYNLTECLSVIRSLNSLNPLITGKTSYSFFDLAATCFPIPSPV